MGRFEELLPEHTKTVERQIGQLQREILSMGHSCDCEHCEYDGVDEGKEEQYEKVLEEISEAKRTLLSLKNYKKRQRTIDEIRHQR